MSQKKKQREIQHELIQKEEWIIDGNYSATMDLRLQACDTIIFLDIKRTICIYRALKRIWQYRNKTRLDRAEGCQERFELDFLKWIWNYPTMNKPEIEKRLKQLSKEKQVIILKKPKEVQRLLDRKDF